MTSLCGKCVSSPLSLKLFLETKFSLKHATEGLDHPLPVSRNRLPVVFVTGWVRFEHLCVCALKSFRPLKVVHTTSLCSPTCLYAGGRQSVWFSLCWWKWYIWMFKNSGNGCSMQNNFILVRSSLQLHHSMLINTVQYFFFHPPPWWLLILIISCRIKFFLKWFFSMPLVCHIYIFRNVLNLFYINHV